MSDLRDELVARLQKLSVEHRPVPGRDDGFAGLRYGGKELGHFHNDHEVDLRLTKRTIEREGLIHPPGSTVHPTRSKSSPWIEVRFATVADLDHVVHLVKLAIAQMPVSGR
jgi:hypothetical protein